VTARRRELALAIDELTARRDFLIIALYRRGVPLRQIARSAGLHYTRIRQLAAAAQEVEATSGVTNVPPSAERKAARRAKAAKAAPKATKRPKR
jgi:hypothetical protein